MSKLLIFKYLKYLFSSKNRHGTHSPFIYDLITKVLNDKEYKKEYSQLQKLKNTKLTKIKVKHQRLIYRLIKYFNPENILVIGESKHTRTLFLSKMNPNSSVFFYNTRLEKISEIEKHNRKHIKHFEFIYIDTKYNANLTLKSFISKIKYVHNNSVIVIKNIRRSKETEKTWKQIINQKDVSVSVDLFFTGLVFFRKEQAKENFIIRF